MAKKDDNSKTNSFINPIDLDKVADNPGLLPYAHSAGGAVIRPEDQGRIKGMAVTAMYDQTSRQMDQLRTQMELLVQQAESLKMRQQVSEIIYNSNVPFTPVIHQIYFLYQRNSDGAHLLSLVAPDEWGRKKPYEHLATVRLLGDHTWEVLDGTV